MLEPHARRPGCLRAIAARPRSTWTRVVDALVALGRLAAELEDVVQSVDINPFVALPQGGLALDALIVLQRQASVELPTSP